MANSTEYPKPGAFDSLMGGALHGHDAGGPPRRGTVIDADAGDPAPSSRARKDKAAPGERGTRRIMLVVIVLLVLSIIGVAFVGAAKMGWIGRKQVPVDPGVEAVIRKARAPAQPAPDKPAATPAAPPAASEKPAAEAAAPAVSEGAGLAPAPMAANVAEGAAGADAKPAASQEAAPGKPALPAPLPEGKPAKPEYVVTAILKDGVVLTVDGTPTVVKVGERF